MCQDVSDLFFCLSTYPASIPFTDLINCPTSLKNMSSTSSAFPGQGGSSVELNEHLKQVLGLTTHALMVPAIDDPMDDTLVKCVSELQAMTEQCHTLGAPSSAWKETTAEQLNNIKGRMQTISSKSQASRNQSSLVAQCGQSDGLPTCKDYTRPQSQRCTVSFMMSHHLYANDLISSDTASSFTAW